MRRAGWEAKAAVANPLILFWGLGSKIYFKGFSRDILSSILYKSLGADVD